TANLASIANHIPATGVYAALAHLQDGTMRKAAVNIGHLPSIDDQLPLSVEAHILDWHGDCYHQQLSLDFVQRIRSEQKFSNIEDLKNQIAQDVADVRALKF
ncbi:MAG: bifunctional riboflavin kinase/FMN adenylyltransferase, partial [Planctomycetes bacterium]|nr:bifunctional riboflavin kinase/FMN adenylyltransferase [Planctomycetota bacterium]